MNSPTCCCWLTFGQRYTYVARKGRGDDIRRGITCKVLTVPRTGGGPANARVVFDDGYITIVPAGVLRKTA